MGVSPVLALSVSGLSVTVARDIAEAVPAFLFF
jgi:hypothetical protein